MMTYSSILKKKSIPKETEYVVKLSVNNVLHPLGRPCQHMLCVILGLVLSMSYNLKLLFYGSRAASNTRKQSKQWNIKRGPAKELVSNLCSGTIMS